MTIEFKVISSIRAIEAFEWDALAGDMPLLSHAFLAALEDSASVGEQAGWQICHLLALEDTTVVGAMPLYLKYHSYGEYVFDWAWAEAYERNGLAYYPKLLSAIPFTPLTSERLLTKNSHVQILMIQALTTLMQQQKLSSVHVNFPAEKSMTAFKAAGWLQRIGVQFCWENTNFKDFDAFLMTLSHDKRKKIRQERKKIVAQGVLCRRIKGHDISPEYWQFFYECYVNTYREHRSTPYLTLDFFLQIGNTIPNNIVLMLAYQDGQPIAAALNIYHATTLYGRYWGAIRYVSNLHFELCYYQAQEFCIAENIQYFEGGAQGEHKLARGFKPRATCSFHQIAHPDFAAAIEDFVSREQLSITTYTNELEERAPFKQS